MKLHQPENIEIIEASRNNVLRKVNEEFICMYWSVGEYLSAESKNVDFGEKYIDTIEYVIMREFCYFLSPNHLKQFLQFTYHAYA